MVKARHFLSADARHRIEEAVRAAETRTRGEFVTVIARASDEYLHITLLWAALIAMLVPAALAPFAPLRAYSYEIQLAVFVTLALVLRLAPLKMRLVPERLQRVRAQRLAQEQFYARGLHRTAEGTGILLFVSVAEHYVAVLADEGIHQRVAPGEWDSVIAAFVREVRAGRIAEGFVAAISACGDRLAHHFPRRPQDTNQLPDRIIEL